MRFRTESHIEKLNTDLDKKDKALSDAMVSLSEAQK